MKTLETILWTFTALIFLVGMGFVINECNNSQKLDLKAEETCEPYQRKGFVNKDSKGNNFVICATEDGGFVAKQLR